MSTVKDRLERLESVVADQQERIEAQQAKIDAQQAQIEEQERTISHQRKRLEAVDDEADDGGDAILNRRTALQAGGILGLLGVGAGAASADPQGQIGTSSDPLQALYTEEINGGVTGDQTLTNLAGSGLTITAGSLEATGSSQWSDSDTNSLLEPSGTETGIDVETVQTDTLTDDGSGQVSMGTTLDLGGNTVTNVGTLSGTTVNTDTLAPNTSSSVSLAGHLDTDGNDLTDSGMTIWDAGNSYIPTARLESDSVAIAGNTVSLGGSTGIGHGDLSNVTATDHHIRPSAGNALADNSNTFDVQSGGIGSAELAANAVTGTEIDLATIAGNNLTVDTTNDELDAAVPALAEADSDGLLEPTGSETGIDVTTVRSTTLEDADGHAHLTLTSGGPLQASQTVDTAGNSITDVGTIDTNDNRNLTLDPGPTNTLTLQNLPTQEDNVLTIDGSGNLGTSSTGSARIGTQSYTGAAVHLLSDQPLSTATSYVTIQFDTKEYDTGNNFDTSTHEFTAPKAGHYAVNATISVNRVETDGYELAVLKNGSALSGARVECTDTESNGSFGRTLLLSSGDTVRIAVYLFTSVSSDTIRADSSLSIDYEG